jgi:hypothetical protein
MCRQECSVPVSNLILLAAVVPQMAHYAADRWGAGKNGHVTYSPKTLTMNLADNFQILTLKSTQPSTLEPA